MNKIQFLQESLQHSTERLIGADAECRNLVIMLAKEKEKYVKEKINGNIFPASAILETTDISWPGKSDVRYKVIGVDGKLLWSYKTPIQGSYDENNIIGLTITFMRDPQEILESKIKLTEKERFILKSLKTSYERSYMYSEDKEKINALGNLKHEIRLAVELSWTYNFDDIMDEIFIKKGLIAVTKIV